jgi:hypothetical protein
LIGVLLHLPEVGVHVGVVVGQTRARRRVLGVEKVGVERRIVQLARRRELDGVVEYCGGVLVLVVDRGGSEASRWNWRKRADGHGSIEMEKTRESRSRARAQGVCEEEARAHVRSLVPDLVLLAHAYLSMAI